MVTLDNGAVVKSVHGGLIREPNVNSYQLYCQNGMMETGRFKDENKKFNYYQEDEKVCSGKWEKYDPENQIQKEYAEKVKTHGGGDFYATYFFVQKILGKPDGQWSIDVYQAVDMGICGILGWRSAINGNQPVKVPNLRNPEERDAYRNDHACTTLEVAGDQLVPITTHKGYEVPDELFAKLEQYWREGRDANGDMDTHYAGIVDVKKFNK
jgi:hypothetical protein